MGQAKREFMEYQDTVERARGLCVEFGALQECPVHDGEYFDTLEYLDMDELVAAMLKHEPTSIQHFKDKAEMLAAVTEAMQTAGEECGYCESNRNS